MNKAIKKKWLKALRSGEYEQGRERLCSIAEDGTHRFCCLGVLVNEVEGFAEYGEPGEYGGLGVPTRKFIKRVGLDRHPSAIDELTYRNDGGIITEGDMTIHTEPQTFEQIAAYIEKHL